MKKRIQKNLVLNKHCIAKLIDLKILKGGTNTNTTDVDSNTNPLTMSNCECNTTHTINDATCETTCSNNTATTNPVGVTNPPPLGGTATENCQ